MKELNEVVKFLCGESQLNGLSFGERRGGLPTFWWRKNLREAVEKVNAPAENYICCEALDKALGDHNGLHSQTIGSHMTDEIDSVIMYKGGDYKIRNRIVVQYCPFCGKPRRRASEYKKGGA